MAAGNPPFAPAEEIQALEGTTEALTGLDYPPKTRGPATTPTITEAFHRDFQRIHDLVSSIAAQGKCFSKHSGLGIQVQECTFMLGGVVKAFAGVSLLNLSDDTETFLWLDSTPALQSGAALPADLTTFLPVASVVTASGEVSTIVDLRSRIALLVPQNLSAAFATDALDNLDSVAISESLVSDTDNTDDLGSLAIAWRSLVLRTSFVMQQAGGKYTTTWANPGADRVLTIIDPGASAEYVLTAGVQILLQKTLVTPTIASMVNANHDHADAAGGGALSNTSHGTGKYFPYSLAHYEAGTLSTGVLLAQYTAPFDFTLRSVTGRVNTAPTGDTLIVDTRINGSSIHGSQADMVSIVAGAFQDTSQIDEDHEVLAGDAITFEVEQIGSGVAGSDLTMTINGLAALDTV